jgi:hypothetical protein
MFLHCPQAVKISRVRESMDSWPQQLNHLLLPSPSDFTDPYLYKDSLELNLHQCGRRLARVCHIWRSWLVICVMMTLTSISFSKPQQYYRLACARCSTNSATAGVQK